ncbi:MAG: hypothetical protein DYH06_11775 [Acidobacteria bacterium ACB2]|nr:hypothetical protein [Acidobacteria bacterium ACB2]
MRSGFLTSLATLLVLTAPLAGAKGSVVVDLAFTPSDEIQDVRPKDLDASALQVPLAFELLSDARSGDRTRIAENREDDAPIPMFTHSDVPGFVTAAMKTCFVRWGGIEKADAPKRLRGELVRLFVVETGRYRSEMQARLRLEDAAGKVLWEGSLVGAAEKYGRSRKPENYREVISDTVMDLTAKLLADPGFRAAWVGRPAGAAGEGAAPAGRAQRRLEPEAAKAEVLALMREGFAEATLVDYARGTELTRALSAAEMIDWKRAGIPQAVISAFLAPAPE